MGLIYLRSETGKAKGRDMLARYIALRPNALDRKMIEFMIGPDG